MAAAVTITSLCLNLASNPDDPHFFPSMSALEPTLNQSGEIREYANGRSRLIRRASLTTVINVTLPQLERDQINWLKSNIGQIMIARDDRGNKIPCAYLSVPVKENQGETTGDVTLTLTEITHSEVV